MTLASQTPVESAGLGLQATGVEVRSLRKSFADGTVALDGVDFECPPGKVLVLLGPSGCGKTTLLRCIAGLEQPTSGRVLIGGKDVTNRGPSQRSLGMVFQNFGLYPDKTVANNIAFPLKMARMPGTARRARVAEIGRMLQIGHLLDRKPAQLSGGQKQRVGIGRALAGAPGVVLMDEPLSALDAQLRGDMRGELLKLQKRLHMSMVYVTHDQTEAMTLGDMVAVMRHGRVEQLAPPREVFQRPATTYVAAFVGGMNLLDAQSRTDGTVVLKTKEDVQTFQAGAPPGSVTLGVRTEDLRIVGTGQDTGPGLRFEGRVDYIEALGADQLVHVRTDMDNALRVRCGVDVLVPEHVRLHAPMGSLHLFGADGRRVQHAMEGTT